MANATIKNVYHYHNSNCQKTCTISYSNANAQNNSSFCCGGSTDPNSGYTCWGFYANHSSCGNSKDKIGYHSSIHDGGICPSSIPSKTHTYYTCGYTEGQLIETLIVYK